MKNTSQRNSCGLKYFSKGDPNWRDADNANGASTEQKQKCSHRIQICCKLVQVSVEMKLAKEK